MMEELKPYFGDEEPPFPLMYVVLYVFEKAEQIGVSVNLVNEPQVWGCSGMYYPETKEIWVATDKPVLEWVLILMHEFSHAMQVAENSPVITQMTKKYKGKELDATNVVALRIDEDPKFFEYPSRIRNWAIKAVSDMEIDAEQRVVKMLKFFDMGHLISIEEYTKKSMAYGLFYFYIKEFGGWYTQGSEPYNLPEIYEAMPSEFSLDIKRLSKSQKDTYKKFYPRKS